MALRASAAGVDTWAPAWRVTPDSAHARHLEALCSIPSARGGKLMAQPVAGHRILFWPASGLLKAEGHPTEHGLAPVRSLPAALDRLHDALDVAGVEPPRSGRKFVRHRESQGFAGLRRIDLTVDLRADDRDEGRQLLAAFEAAARSSGHHAPTYGRPGKPGATVYVAGEGGVLGRWYDKGVESGSAAPFRLIRPEAQWRFANERGPEDLDELGDVAAMRDRFAKRWGPWCRGRIVVGDMTELGRKLAEAVEAGRITPAEARRIAGYLVMEPHGIHDAPRTRQRLRAEAAGFGFHLVDGVLEPLEVDLGAALDEAEQLDPWESGAT